MPQGLKLRCCGKAPPLSYHLSLPSLATAGPKVNQSTLSSPPLFTLISIFQVGLGAGLRSAPPPNKKKQIYKSKTKGDTFSCPLPETGWRGDYYNPALICCVTSFGPVIQVLHFTHQYRSVVDEVVIPILSPAITYEHA